MSFLESDASKNHPSLIFNANYSPFRGNQLASFSFQPFSIEIKENLELIGNHLISTHTNFEEGKKQKNKYHLILSESQIRDKNGSQ